MYVPMYAAQEDRHRLARAGGGGLGGGGGGPFHI